MTDHEGNWFLEPISSSETVEDGHLGAARPRRWTVGAVGGGRAGSVSTRTATWKQSEGNAKQQANDKSRAKQNKGSNNSNRRRKRRR